MFKLFYLTNGVTFNNHKVSFDHKDVISFEENDNQIIIETTVVIENLERGWVGDIVLHLSGADIDYQTEQIEIDEDFLIKDVICIRRELSWKSKETASWRYTFLKN